MINYLPVEVLLIEDNPGDIRLIKDALLESKVLVNITSIEDGLKALQYLNKEAPYTDAHEPDVILLDLNLPHLDGLGVLTKIKENQALRRIPVIILTTSDTPQDIMASYEHFASAYLVKPIDFNSFLTIIASFEEFWLALVKLPSY